MSVMISDFENNMNIIYFRDPAHGIELLKEWGFIDGSSARIVEMLSNAQCNATCSNAGFSKQKIGEYLSTPKNREVLL